MAVSPAHPSQAEDSTTVPRSTRNEGSTNGEPIIESLDPESILPVSTLVQRRKTQSSIASLMSQHSGERDGSTSSHVSCDDQASLIISPRSPQSGTRGAATGFLQHLIATYSPKWPWFRSQVQPKLRRRQRHSRSTQGSTSSTSRDSSHRASHTMSRLSFSVDADTSDDEDHGRGSRSSSVVCALQRFEHRLRAPDRSRAGYNGALLGMLPLCNAGMHFVCCGSL